MNKFAVSACVLLVLCLGTSALYEGWTYEIPTPCATIYAGQHYDAGDVCISIDNEQLTVTYTMNEGYCMKEIHLWVGYDASLIPNNKGNPIPGKFPIKQAFPTCISAFSHTMPLPLGPQGTACFENLLVAAHSSILRTTESGTASETGWSEGIAFPGKNWATYSSFFINCVPPPPPPPPPPSDPETCETAFAVGQTNFAQLGSNRWGWQITIPNGGSYTTQLYAGAAQNDITKGTLVGSLTVQHSGNIVTVCYIAVSGASFDTVHVYASSVSIPTNIMNAPGQYGNTVDNDGATNVCVNANVAAGATQYFIVAHAESCRTFNL